MIGSGTFTAANSDALRIAAPANAARLNDRSQMNEVLINLSVI
jgi:hypothetical protein